MWHKLFHDFHKRDWERGKKKGHGNLTFQPRCCADEKAICVIFSPSIISAVGYRSKLRLVSGY